MHPQPGWSLTFGVSLLRVSPASSLFFHFLLLFWRSEPDTVGTLVPAGRARGGGVGRGPATSRFHMNLGVTDVTRRGLLCSWFKPEVHKLWPHLAPRLFLNKVLLEHGPSCFHATAELSGFHRDQVATKPKTFTISSFSGAWRPALHLEASGKARRVLGGTREWVGAVCRALSVDSAPLPHPIPRCGTTGVRGAPVPGSVPGDPSSVFERDQSRTACG